MYSVLKKFTVEGLKMDSIYDGSLLENLINIYR